MISTLSVPRPLLELVYHGKPATKKNRPKLIPYRDKRTGRERTIVVPDDAYTKAERAAIREIGNWLTYRRVSLPLDQGGRELHVRALFFLGARQRPDLDGLFTACADILEAAGVIANDYRIASWDGSRRLRDAADPRTEVSIWEVS